MAMMETMASTFLFLTFCCYGFGILAGVMRPKTGRFLPFGAAVAAGIFGAIAAVCFLGQGGGGVRSFELLATPLPLARFSIRADPLSAFFLLIIYILI